jgi:hypothetical protein
MLDHVDAGGRAGIADGEIDSGDHRIGGAARRGWDRAHARGRRALEMRNWFGSRPILSELWTERTIDHL